MEETIDYLYIKPYTRFSPYLGGLLIGYILYKIKDKKIELKSTTVVAFWTVAVVIFSFTLHMTYKRDVITWLCALWFSLGKFMFGLFIGSVILICQLGYGGKQRGSNNVSYKIANCFKMFQALFQTLWVVVFLFISTNLRIVCTWSVQSS